ncbi:uncharacterized protein Z520_12347 [Fonsecaea multimorphosa CBS 102226]|uniref:Uncharacterized protein n=1 Tax=Fonsecaea multimorphosa CBS 102226 TaxID=1442371 RepID=A0A0D2K6F9_9EURO|nr:uncharacterized protein Z520_12347 [Fonsecaea multimorphosa CBS 102226]KIX91958.1 hypothetical protein Z520_12347 [Fonsecaea multimorphosa CBS 102226]OAL17329.1 hypothetical protein AYO22_11771 [Fonsecaea multimorphosa]
MLPSATRVRDKYTSRACNECQRRKRKCSGENVCRNCRHWGTDCVFSQPRGLRHSRAANERPPRSLSTAWDTAPSNGSSSRPSASNEVTGTENHENVALRTQETEDTSGNPQTSPGRVTTQPHDNQQTLLQQSPAGTTSGNNHGQTPFSTIESEQSSHQESVFERNTNFTSGNALFQQIDLLNKVVSRSQGTETTVANGFVGGSTTQPNATMIDTYRDIDQIVEQTRSEDPIKIHESLDMFFTNIQPYYPCMNEGHLRAQFSAFVANDSNCLTKSCTVQLAALLSFIMAAVNVLYDMSAHCEHLPGWKEFCRGEKLLNHATWLEKANILTIQTLIIKTLYLMYVGLVNSAYDTMGTTVRLCFQFGLHNEASWGDNCKFYDRTYRQRVLWSVFCLNHNVAQTRGVPEFLRESDFNVGLPKCVDDRMLYPNCPALLEMPSTSPVTSLLEIIKLTKLSSEIWETMFSVRARRPVSQEFITTMDNKIVKLSQDMPISLRWPPSPETKQVVDGAPAFIQQQGFVLHLRLLYLRMLLRREEMISLTYGIDVAKSCIDIAREVVSVVETFYTSQRTNRCARHAYLQHLVGALVPMTCIIVRQDNGEELTRPAITLFQKALKLMETFAQGSFLARHVLQHMQRPIKAARDAIELRRPQNARASTFPPTSSGSSSTQLPASSFGQAQNSARNSANVQSEWELSFPNGYHDLFQDPLQMPPDIPFMFDDNGIDIWDNFTYGGIK